MNPKNPCLSRSSRHLIILKVLSPIIISSHNHINLHPSLRSILTLIVIAIAIAITIATVISISISISIAIATSTAQALHPERTWAHISASKALLILSLCSSVRHRDRLFVPIIRRTMNPTLPIWTTMTDETIPGPSSFDYL